MLTRILALVVALAAAPAFAATTWTADTTTPYRTSKAVCTTGTEAAPSVATQGLPLNGLAGFTVHAEAAAAMTAGGVLQAYLWNPVTARWNRAPDLDLTVSAVQWQSFAGFQVAAGTGRIAYVPSGIGQAVNIYVIGGR